jgi:hypothetical protein
MKTPVLFRTWKTNADDVFALFPTLAGDNDPRTCTCYQHVGQHSSAHYDHCISMSRPATKAERAPLAKELSRIGYAFTIVRRCTQAFLTLRYGLATLRD